MDLKLLELIDSSQMDNDSDYAMAKFNRLTPEQFEKWWDALYFYYYEYPSCHMVTRHFGVTDRR
jgi:hypothetical protein